MRKIVDYQTVTADKSSDLDELVRNEIDCGWQPIGDQHRFDGKYEQVMVQYDEMQEVSQTLSDIMGFGKQLTPLVGQADVAPVGRTAGLSQVSEPLQSQL